MKPSAERNRLLDAALRYRIDQAVPSMLLSSILVLNRVDAAAV
jgi:hypothetical protein